MLHQCEPACAGKRLRAGRDCVKLWVRIDSSKVIAMLAEEGGTLRVSRTSSRASERASKVDNVTLDDETTEKLRSLGYIR